MKYTIECPVCKQKTMLNNAKSYQGKTVRFSCKNESCGEKITHLVCINEADSTLVVQSEHELGKAARLLVLPSVYNQETALILIEGRQRIGRKSPKKKIELSISSTDSSMSREHCLIVGHKTKNDQVLFTVQDLNSRNQVHVNGRMLDSQEECYLKSGDLLRIGATEMKFEYI